MKSSPIGWVAVLVAALALTGRDGTTSGVREEVRARAFYLVDDHNRERVRIRMKGSWPSVEILDEESKARIALKMDFLSSQISINGKDGKIRVSLVHYNDAKATELSLFNEEDGPGIVANPGLGQGPFLNVLSPSGAYVSTHFGKTGEPGICGWDKNKKRVFCFPKPAK